MKSFAVVGVGNYAEDYIKILEKLEKEKVATLFCAVVRNRDKYQNKVKALDADGVVIYPSYEKLLSYGKSNVDIIALPIATKDHFELAHKALDAGYDVIVERPVALTIQEVDALIETRKKSEKYCVVGNEFLYSSSINLICNEISSGRMGRIKKIRCMSGMAIDSTFFQRNDWGGKLLVEGKWNLDGPATNHGAAVLMNAIFLAQTTCHPNSDIDWVQAELYRAYAISSYDTVSMRIMMKNDIEIDFVGTYAIDNTVEPAMEVECEDATIFWNFQDEKTIIKFHSGRKKIFRERHTEDKYALVFREAITVTTTRTRNPNSTIENSRSHVLAMNLAFESAQEIITIPDEFIVPLNNGTKKRTTIKAMGDLLSQAYAEGKLFSELGIAWAKPSKPVTNEAYDSFPQNPKLKKWLK